MPTNNNNKQSKAVLIRASDVEPEQINWLWPGRIALGKITLITGDPGLGKSLLTAALATHVSLGSTWPDDSPCPRGDVVFLSAEDGLADTIRPRLDAAGAECHRIHFLSAIREEQRGETKSRTFSLKRDIKALELAAQDVVACRLVVIDPVSAYLDDTDSNTNSDVRGLLAPLAAFAEDNAIAVVVVSHLNKNTAGSALYRTTGSLAFVAAARAAHLVAKDKDKNGRRLFLPLKNNLAKDDTGLAYKIIEGQNGSPVVAWESGPVAITAQEALNATAVEKGHTDTDEAVEFLRTVLANGPLSANDGFKEAGYAGISKKRLERARGRLGIVTKKLGFEKGWEWSLPAEDPQEPPFEDTGVLPPKGDLREAQTPEQFFDALPDTSVVARARVMELFEKNNFTFSVDQIDEYLEKAFQRPVLEGVLEGLAEKGRLNRRNEGRGHVIYCLAGKEL